MAINFLVTIAFQLMTGTIIGAVILRESCKVFNKWFKKDFVIPVAEEITLPAIESPPTLDNNPYRATLTSAHPQASSEIPNGVNVPDFGRALGIMFSSFFAELVFLILLVMVIRTVEMGRLGGVAARSNPILLVGLLGGTSGLVIQSLFISKMLPTSFGRAITISILMLLIVLSVVAVVALVSMGISLVLS